MDEPLKHVLRPKPPWETIDYTHCGRLASKVPTSSVDALEAHVKRHGRQRTAFAYCMTCVDRVQAYSRIDTVANKRVPITWENHPTAVTARWLEKIPEPDGAERQRRTLHALAALVRAHQDEFDAMVAFDGASLSARRGHR